MSAIKKGFFIIILGWITVGCGSDRFNVDVSDLSIDQQQIRIDKRLSEKDNVEQEHIKLLSEETGIYKEYFENILELGDANQPVAYKNMLGFLNDPMMMDVQAEIDKSFTDDEIYPTEFINAFKHYKYYFPNELVPDIAFYNSGFNYGVYPTPEFIGVGLEWYIGKDNKLLDRLPPSQFPKYLKDKMQKEFMVADCLRGYLLVKYSDKIDGQQLINQLVYFGKIAYLMDACMPAAPDHLKYGYQEPQAYWCENNEFLIWKSLVNEDLLYSKNRKMINGFIGNAPFTKGFSEKSPGKIAFFIGKMMVADYMDTHEEVTLKQLLNVSSPEILKAYRPKK